jgi:hypothetical protein
VKPELQCLPFNPDNADEPPEEFRPYVTFYTYDYSRLRCVNRCSVIENVVYCRINDRQCLPMSFSECTARGYDNEMFTGDDEGFRLCMSL